MTRRGDSRDKAGPAEPGGESGRAVVYCIVPRELAPKLHEPLRRHFRDREDVEVVVERREGERRRAAERRRAEGGKAAETAGTSKAAEVAGEGKAAKAGKTAKTGKAGKSAPERPERRAIRAKQGRRVGERRAKLDAVKAPELPRKARPHADSLRFVKRVEPAAEHAEDLDTARIVMRCQAGEREEFGILYTRYFDRIYSYMKSGLSDPHEAEDAAQDVFLKALEALPRYERRRQPFRAWLFAIARNHLITLLEKQARVEVVDPAAIERMQKEIVVDEPRLGSLDWIANTDLLFLVERLPESQRQVLELRYLLQLKVTEIAEVLGTTPNAVSALQHRAFTFIRERLAAAGRTPNRGERRTPAKRWVKPAQVARRRRTALL